MAIPWSEKRAESCIIDFGSKWESKRSGGIATVTGIEGEHSEYVVYRMKMPHYDGENTYETKRVNFLAKFRPVNGHRWLSMQERRARGLL